MPRLVTEPGSAPWRGQLHEIIFGTKTRAGRIFDVVLLWTILISVSVVLLESIPSIQTASGPWLVGLEWGFTALFTIEYVLRLVVMRKPWKYALSAYGIIDLLAILPSYLSLFFFNAQSLIVIRALRLLRVFYVLQLDPYWKPYWEQTKILMRALKNSHVKITVFMGSILTIVVIMGTAMYLIEGKENGFTSIPKAMYWAIVTMTTVGYGDLAPRTPLGQTLASILMIIGYAIIVGIVSVELAQANRAWISTQSCPSCSEEGHEPDAIHCKFCGAKL